MDVKFYLCPTCGNIVYKVEDSGVVPECCGSKMILMEPKSTDNGTEKHLPAVEWLDDCTLRVRIGSLPHPCTQEHFIQMIAIRLKDGIIIKRLCKSACSDYPQAVFHCRKDEVTGVYSYCNLHGLWHLALDPEIR
ncbi:MAG: desulfoferrodoxin family protein [Bacteroidales bacterium]|nr:desulfoferrodoxin family protein [Bacteroidales bacterium]MDY3782993.1 desulfoferrodoxin family protein [Candidatus Cryptobacteroides sp.]